MTEFCGKLGNGGNKTLECYRMHMKQKQPAKLPCFDGRSIVTSVEQASDILSSVMGLG